jgi:PKD repeat protein
MPLHPGPLTSGNFISLNMKKLYSILIILFSLVNLHSQTDKNCGADEINLELLQQHPELLGNWIKNYINQEQFISDYQNLSAGERADTIFKIPVVVHVIHFDGPENISNAQIENGIQILTRNYRKQNPDTALIVPFFQPIAADMEIEFELAKIDPYGNCTNGINRVRSTLTTTGDHAVKDLIHWPREKYLNIYIVRNAAGLAGHALMPFQADTISAWDGIVICGDYFGNTGTSNDLKSVVLSHETGHFLNLYHIWGGNNVPGFYYLPVGDTGNCAYDDGVFDTPNTIGWATCNLAGNTCDTVLDNVQNFMDYAYCAKMFTEGQKIRARACLHSPLAQRNNLWTDPNLTATGLSLSPTLCTSDFTVARQTYCPGDSAQFWDNSYNGATQWNWDFGDGGTSALQNPKHAYATNGLYDVTLTVSNGISTITTTKNDVVYILESASSFYLPYTEGFEWIDSLTDTRMVGFVENDEPWEVVQGIYASGDQSLRANCENDSFRYKYILISPVLDLTGLIDPVIDFKYAFAQKDTLNNDVMYVKASKNCGQSFSTLNTQLATLPTHSGLVNGNYIPDPADWRQMSITNIGGAFLTNTFIFKIEFIGGGGNNFYIDDINVYDNASIGIEKNEELFVRIQPNPTNNYFEIVGDFENAEIQLMNMQGQLVMSKKVLNGEKISVEGVSSGIYVVQIRDGNSVSHKRIIIN